MLAQMPAAVVLQRDERDVQVWLSTEQRMEMIDARDVPPSATVGTPLELNIDARCRVQECSVMDRPLKMQTIQGGKIMFLDIFIFPQPSLAFSLYFGAIQVDSDFSPVDTTRSYLTYVTWDHRRCEMIILKQSPPRSLPTNAEDTKQIREAYDKYRAMQLEETASTGHQEKEKLTAAIMPMREESRREEDRSMSDRMSSISARMDSVSVRDEKRFDNRKSSVISSQMNTRMDPPPMNVSRPVSDYRESIQSKSGYSREAGSAYNSSGRMAEEKELPWEKGIVTGEYQGDQRDRKKFIVSTRKGMANVYHGVYGNLRRPLQVGDYVKAQLRLRDGCVYDVEDLVVSNSGPPDHSVHMDNGRLFITCDVKYTERLIDNYKWWLIAENAYLGPIGVESGRGEENMVGRKDTITVTPMEPGLSIMLEKTGARWVAEKVPPKVIVKTKEVTPPFDGWFTGVVTTAIDSRVLVASPLLKEDAELNEKHDPVRVTGLWIKFQLWENSPTNPIAPFIIEPKTFSKISPVFETRVTRLGIPEIRVPISYGGEEDDGRPLLNSEMGPVRDCDGLIKADRDCHGHYVAWIMRYHGKNHVSRWRIVKEDPKVERARDREVNRSRSPSPTTLRQNNMEERGMREERLSRMERQREEKTDNGRLYEEGELELRGIMRRVILENELIRTSLIEFDREVYNEMFEILFHDQNN